VRIAPDAPDGVLVNCHNGGLADALAVKDALRATGVLSAFTGKRRELSKVEKQAIRQAEAQREAERHAQWQRLPIWPGRDSHRPRQPPRPILTLWPSVSRQSGSGRAAAAGADAGREGRVQNVQAIAPDGFKLFSKGARTSGLFWWAGKAVAHLVIGEGMATMAAIRRATGLPVVAALSANNLPVVAKAIHLKRPDLLLTIAADDDAAGFKAAREAAAMTGANMTIPRISA
jgi:putative DNA primase/helicase